MSTISYLALLATVTFIGYFLYRKIKNNSKNKRGQLQDPAMQEVYIASKVPKDEEISLTTEEKVDLSWQFLIDITTKILDKFTKSDQDIMHQAGEKLNKHCMIYQHNVGAEAKITMDIIKSRTKEQNKNKGSSRTR